MTMHRIGCRREWWYRVQCHALDRATITWIIPINLHIQKDRVQRKCSPETRQDVLLGFSMASGRCGDIPIGGENSLRLSLLPLILILLCFFFFLSFFLYLFHSFIFISMFMSKPGRHFVEDINSITQSFDGSVSISRNCGFFSLVYWRFVSLDQ